MMIYTKKESIVRAIAKNAGVSYTTAYTRLKEQGLVVSKKERLEFAQKKREKVGLMRARGMSYKEIADELDVSVNVVKSLARQYKEKTAALQQELALL